LKAAYDNPPDDMINNKACISDDAFVTVLVANIGLDLLKDLFTVLQEAYNQRKG